jgi:hypothetical protein
MPKIKITRTGEALVGEEGCGLGCIYLQEDSMEPRCRFWSTFVAPLGSRRYQRCPECLNAERKQ